MLIERLKREITRSSMGRNFEVPTQIPRQMMLGPKVLLVNNYSASDGDLFPYSFKKNKLGKVIGVRTWGGVVGIRGSLPFVDGTQLRKPEFASYSAEKSDWIIEGYGVDPDIVVDNDPAKEYAGEDQQLNKAIEVILEELKNNKNSIPPIPQGPDKSK
jgi:tricorn protease